MSTEATSATAEAELTVGRDLSRHAQRRSLKWFYLLAGANTAFAQCTFGGGMFPLYLRELGLSPERIGAVIGTIPFLQVLALVATPVIERLGYRRSYLLFYGSRKFTIMALILSPWILDAFGSGILFRFVTVCVLLFGIQRALGETAFYPWLQEVVPDDIRGRTQGTASLCGLLAAGMGLLLAGFLVDHSRDLGLGRFGGFQAGYLFFALIGLLGVASAMRMAGGHAVERHPSHPPFLRRLREALRDRRFLAFLLGAGVLQGSFVVFGTFLSLYAKDVLGISSGRVVQLNIASMAGGTVAGYFWGCAADRYGSRRILTLQLSLLALMPPGWICLPLVPPAALVPAVGVCYFLFGTIFFGTLIASLRLMYNTIVPQARKGEYLAVRYAIVGLVAGSMPALAGQSIGLFQNVRGSWLGIPLHPFAPLFGVLTMVWAGTAWLFSRIREQGERDHYAPV